MSMPEINKSDQPDSLPSSIKRVNEFGESVAGRIKQEQKYLTEEEIGLLIFEYAAGKTTYALSDKFGCNRKTVSGILKKHGVTVTKSKIKKLDIADVVSMYENMHTIKEISAKYNVGPNVISRCLRSHGVF